jgi:hypothetical protein
VELLVQFTNKNLVLKDEFSITYDLKHHRLCCQGHIINLLTISFLFVTDKENLELDDKSNLYKNILLQQIAEWKKKGPLRMLYNIVLFLYNSEIRINQFKRLSRNHKPACDNSTR